MADTSSPSEATAGPDPLHEFLTDVFGGSVGSTMVTTLWSRAHAAEHWPETHWHDEQAEQVWQRLVEHSQAMNRNPEDLVVKSKMNGAGTVWRSWVIDNAVKSFAAEHPDGIDVVTLGIGLCNRAHRLKDLNATWYGYDFPEGIALRRRLIDDDVVTVYGGSITEDGWEKTLPTSGRPLCVVAEGILMYLTDGQVRGVFDAITSQVPGVVRCIADSHNHRLIGSGRTMITKKTGAVYQFGCDSPQQFATIAGPGWHGVEEIDVMAFISPTNQRISRIYHRVYGSRMYTVKVIEKAAHS